MAAFVRFLSTVEIILISMIVFCFATVVQAREAIDISKPLMGLQLIGKAEVFEDAGKIYKTPQDLPANLNWLELDQHNLEMGLSTSAFWLRFEIVNNSDTEQDWYMFHDLAFQDYVDVFEYDAGNWHVHKLSSRIPFSDRELPTFRLGMKDSVPAREKALVYVRLENEYVEQTTLSMRLWKGDELSEQRERETLVIALFCGLMLAIVMIWLIFAITLNLKRLFSYCGFILCIVLVFADSRGIAFKYLYPDWPDLHNRLFVACVFMTAGFSLAFCSQHLQLVRNGFLKWHRLFTALFTFYCIGAVFTLSGIHHGIAAVISMFAAITIALNLIVAIQVWFTRHEEYVFWFMTAWIMSATAVLLLFSNAMFGWADDLFIFSDFLDVILIFFVLDAILLSLSLARWLEGQEKVRKEAEYDARHDALTGLLNRRAFDATLKHNLTFSRKGDEGLWLVLLDVDHFKKVNDTYGHDAGDHVLVHLAEILRKHCRSDDVICRFGGEEFALIMHNIAEQDALQSIERLLDLFHQKPTIYDEDKIIHTFSAGMAPATAGQGETFDLLFKQADQALYAAKNNGRNRIEIYQKAAIS